MAANSKRTKFILFPLTAPATSQPSAEINSEKLKELLYRNRKSDYEGDYHPHLLEQYKLAIQGAERISDRRTHANNFFLSINSALIAFGAVATGYLSVFGAILWSLVIMVIGLVVALPSMAMSQ